MDLKPFIKRMRASITLFILPALAEANVAPCTTLHREKDDKYNGCHIALAIKDQTSSKPFIYSELFNRSLLTEEECSRFCESYDRTLTNRNMVNIKSYDESYINYNNSGSTNTISLLGIYNGVIDITEAFGAFSDLILNFRFIKMKGQRNIDVGGGKFDDTTAILASFGVINSVYDPNGRTSAQNTVVLNGSPYDSATSISILNVITHDTDRLEHIALVRNNLKCDGYAYFKVYEGDQSGMMKEFQLNQPTEYFRSQIANVFGSDNIIVKKFHHLIMAQKKCSFRDVFRFSWG